MQSFKVLRGISKNLRNASTNNHHLESLSILRSFLLLIPSTIIILFFFALTFPIFLTLLFAIPGLILLLRWITILVTDNSNTGDMKVPTFYSLRQTGEEMAYVFFMSVVGVVFGAIHCAGWYFNFPSSYEAMLWRVCSAVLTGIAFLLPPLVSLSFFLSRTYDLFNSRLIYRLAAFFIIILLAYVASRLLLLVEAFISLRYLTPEMLALVKWTSFIPHI